jgi:hypothetical protein
MFNHLWQKISKEKFSEGARFRKLSHSHKVSINTIRHACSADSLATGNGLKHRVAPNSWLETSCPVEELAPGKHGRSEWMEFPFETDDPCYATVICTLHG